MLVYIPGQSGEVNVIYVGNHLLKELVEEVCNISVTAKPMLNYGGMLYPQGS